MDEKSDATGPYEGGDIIGYLMKQGFELAGDHGAIESITKIRDGAIIVMTYAIFRVEPDWRSGVSISRVTVL